MVITDLGNLRTPKQIAQLTHDTYSLRHLRGISSNSTWMDFARRVVYALAGGGSSTWSGCANGSRRTTVRVLSKETPMPITKADDLPLILTMGDVQRITGLSKDVVYRLPHQKGFPAIRFGRAIRVPRDAFLKWLEAQTVDR
jgi:excisionase family DNA binding protein